MAVKVSYIVCAVQASSGSDDDNKDDSTGGWRAIAARMAARTQTTAPQPNVRILNIGSGRETKPKGMWWRAA